jgi:hypothetical protein
MAKIPKKVLKWRAKQRSGSIMRPEKFEAIKKGAEKSGADDPAAVAGAKYWEEVKEKYKSAGGPKAHGCPEEHARPAPAL